MACRRRSRFRALVTCAAACAAACSATAPSHVAAQEGVTTSGVFSRYAQQVVKIEVVEGGSTARSSIGSGFYVSEAGHVITNYHVIAMLVHEPERYRAHVVHADGSSTALAVLGIDVVHDLAVMTAETPPAAHFRIAPVAPAQGERLYSLGHPRDLGLSIVEGTFNGHLRHTLYPKIHFTGSINPGMSGGPAIDAAGRVVGVNVSTAGNAVSFLVPIERAVDLLARSTVPDYEVPDDLLATVGAQIRDYQDTYLRDLFHEGSPAVELGPFRLLTDPAPFFRCWSSSDRSPELTYESVYHTCSTDDNIYIAGDQRSGVIDVSHEYITSRTLNRFQFHSLYSGIFGTDNTPSGREEHVTSWRCTTRNVGNARDGDVPLRAVLCIRRYRKVGELYDAVLKVAVLGRPREGVVSTLKLSGVSRENVSAVTARYLERIAWR